MLNRQNAQTRNIRVPRIIHDQIKKICARDGLLMGSFVAKIIRKAIMKEEAPKNNNSSSKG